MNHLLKDFLIDSASAQNSSSAFNDRWDSEEEDADEGISSIAVRQVFL
jgi:hypothetical protein